MDLNSTNRSLKNLIVKTLKPLIDGDYSLLDIPTHRNIGDLLIWQGELEFLQKNVSHKMLYSASLDSFDINKIKTSKVILLHGGGNFGDLWTKHQQFREKIINRFNDRKIVIFPQTIYFSDKNNLDRAVKIFSCHPDLTICARDRTSYRMLKTNFKKNKILMLPDMAFCLSDSFPAPQVSLKNRVLYISRSDKELKEHLNISFIKNLEVHDWPTVEMSFPIKMRYFARKLFWKISNKLKSDNSDTFASKNRSSFLKLGASFLFQYDLVITNRLHGQIFASLLGIPSILLDNSYGKNKNFYETWLRNNKMCYYADSDASVKEIISLKFTHLLSSRRLAH